MLHKINKFGELSYVKSHIASIHRMRAMWGMKCIMETQGRRLCPIRIRINDVSAYCYSLADAAGSTDFFYVYMRRFALRDSLSGRIFTDEKCFTFSYLAHDVGTLRVIPMRLCA